MRTRITLACTECKNRNYDTKKDKKTHPDRMETKKYCRFCKKHTLHKETKYWQNQITQQMLLLRRARAGLKDLRQSFIRSAGHQRMMSQSKR